MKLYKPQKMSVIESEIEFRPYRDDDFNAICALYALEGWETPVIREDDFKNALANSSILLCALYENEIVGFLRGLTDGFVTIYVAEIIVRPNMRKRGLGRMLLEQCAANYPKTRIDLLSADEAAGFYASCGFKQHKGFRKKP